MRRDRGSGVIVSLRALRQAAPRPAAGGAFPGWPRCGRPFGRLPPAGLALGGAALGCAALALTPGNAGPAAARALLAALVVGCAWWLLRRRVAPARPSPVRIEALVPLGRSGELAVVEVDGRRFLLGAGERPVALLAELPTTAGRAS